MPEKPLIAIPVAAHTLQELKEKAAAIRSLPFDVLEWRMDGLDALSPELATQGLSLVKSEISTPIIATVRTSKEGGSFPYEDALYESCVTAVMTGLRPGSDAVDVEMERTPAPRLIEKARALGLSVIVSFHDFSRTPKKEDIVSRFLTMKARHASIGKIAVMAHSRDDACTMMDAMAQVHKTAPDFPFIGISMGPFGQITRILGGKAGSILTFASAGEASAPGQISVSAMKQELDKAYR
ncbi:3-dehydroquinate dehydratase [Dialister histaminiformans]|uniref:3-dehydroquinate dehydratase n=1 Tax=Allisonella histaminiformans TaxID=209880 RepID=A0A1G5WEA7_9FIRM|nr:type I 3-dehydroquinate dehydratase [Allisonella histaminiformans]SDA56312.1 3-dehydroquinate dehydratase [Allisonella histaminiformans]